MKLKSASLCQLLSGLLIITTSPHIHNSTVQSPQEHIHSQINQYTVAEYLYDMSKLYTIWIMAFWATP